MGCTRSTHANAAGVPADDGDRWHFPHAGGIGLIAARVWRAYWDWRIRRTTMLILRSLDRRTLHDIGIDPSEIESLVSAAGRDRRRHSGAARFWDVGGV